MEGHREFRGADDRWCEAWRIVFDTVNIRLMRDIERMSFMPRVAKCFSNLTIDRCRWGNSREQELKVTKYVAGWFMNRKRVNHVTLAYLRKVHRLDPPVCSRSHRAFVSVVSRRPWLYIDVGQGGRVTYRLRSVSQLEADSLATEFWNMCADVITESCGDQDPRMQALDDVLGNYRSLKWPDDAPCLFGPVMVSAIVQQTKKGRDVVRTLQYTDFVIHAVTALVTNGSPTAITDMGTNEELTECLLQLLARGWRDSKEDAMNAINKLGCSDYFMDRVLRPDARELYSFYPNTYSWELFAGLEWRDRLMDALKNDNSIPERCVRAFLKCMGEEDPAWSPDNEYTESD